MIPITSTSLLLAWVYPSLWTLVWGGLMLLVMLLGVLVIILVDRWRKRPESDTLSPSDQLTQYRMMLEAGTLTQEEFESLRGVLSTRMRSSSHQVPHPAAETPNTPSSSPSDPGPEEPPSSPEGIRPA